MFKPTSSYSQTFLAIIFVTFTCHFFLEILFSRKILIIFNIFSLNLRKKIQQICIKLFHELSEEHIQGRFVKTAKLKELHGD